MSIEPDAAQIRVLGSLIEKQRTTPEAYPLSVNSLRLACNQSTNRDPVVDYDEPTVLDALEQLGRRRWTRLSSGSGSRSRKYRQLLGEALSLGEADLAVLCVLMLRGPQTPGELNQRSERLYAAGGLDAVQATLDSLIERGLVQRLERRPGQKEQRYRQLLGGDGSEAVGVSPDLPPSAAHTAGTPPEDRLGRLEAEVRELRDEVANLRRELGD